MESALPGALGRAEGLYQAGTPITPTQGVAPFSPDTLASMDMVRGLSGTPSATVQPGLDAWQRTVSGDFLPGPELERSFTAAANRIIPQIQGRFSQGGRTDSGLADVAMSQALSDAYAGQWANLYNAERGRQQAALGMIPGLESMVSASELQPIQALAGIGGAQEAQRQAELDAQYRSQLANLDLPARSFDEYLARLRGIAPFAPQSMERSLEQTQEEMQEGSQTRPLYSNTAGSLLGGAAMAAPLLFGGAPFAAGGAGLLGMLRG